MKTVTTSDARARLPALLKEVAAGAAVTITRHGRPIAVLSPVVGRQFGQFAGLITVPDDFNTPLSDVEFAQWEPGV